MYSSDGLVFKYTIGTLYGIASEYQEHMNAHAGTAMLDAKADFDCALNSLGWVKWKGDGTDEIKRFNNLQKTIIAEVIGMTDEELCQRFRLDWGYLDTWRTIAYKKMCAYLNGG